MMTCSWQPFNSIAHLHASFPPSKLASLHPTHLAFHAHTCYLPLPLHSPQLKFPPLNSLAECSIDPPFQSCSDDAVDLLCPRPSLREICCNGLPHDVLQRAEELGFKYPTDVQAEALPALLAGQDCILHSQTGSGKTLCYLFAIFAKVVLTRAAVQAIIIVPTRELGMQVARAARRFGKEPDTWGEDKSSSGIKKGILNVMTLLEGGSLNRQKSWLKASPPQIIVGTLQCVCKMIETKNLRTKAINTLVIDEVDAMFRLTQHVGLLRILLTAHTVAQNRQTIFASATIPQHNQFIQKCISEKWVKDNVFYVHANPSSKMPTYLRHCHVTCKMDQKLDLLAAVLRADNPKAAIIFVNSEASKRKGLLPMTVIVAEFLSSTCLSSSDEDCQQWEPLVLQEESHIHARTSSLADFQNGKHLLVATDVAARGLDIPDISHVYNFDLPPTAIAYLHRGGRTARKPLTYDQGTVTTFVTEQEAFVFQRYQNEIMFQSTELDIREITSQVQD